MNSASREPRSRIIACLTAVLVLSGPGVKRSFSVIAFHGNAEADPSPGSRYHSEQQPQHHLNRARAALSHALALSDQPESPPHVHVRGSHIQDIKKIRELRFITQAEAIRQEESLAHGRRE